MPGLEDLYREIILDHYRHPRQRGELPTPPAHMIEGFNPLCGDEIKLYVEIGADGTVADIRFAGQGCSISQSSASMMAAAMKGKSLAEAKALLKTFKSMMNVHEHDIGGDGNETGDVDPTLPAVRLGDLEALKGVVRFPVRIKCATLAWNTFDQALTEVGAN
jgi:nitrogen fixation protein NifU and related proteins